MWRYRWLYIHVWRPRWRRLFLAGAFTLLGHGAFAQFVNTNPGNFGYQPIPSYQPNYTPPSYLPPNHNYFGTGTQNVPPPSPGLRPFVGCYYSARGC